MNQIYHKIRKHEYLNNKDIKNIIKIETNGKIGTIFIDKDNFWATCDFDNSNIKISNKIKTEILEYLIDFSEYQDSDRNLNFLVDLYNLYLLSILFHEIEHVKQYQNTNKCLSFKNKIIKENLKNYMLKNYNRYEKNYHLYYHEYDALTKSFIKTLYIINNVCNNLNQNAVMEFNRNMAISILHSYTDKYQDEDSFNNRKKFCSPICYTKFLSRFWNTSNQRKIISVCINDLKKNSKTEYQKLVNGLPLANETLEYIYDVCTNSYNTCDLLEEIKNDMQKTNRNI